MSEAEDTRVLPVPAEEGELIETITHLAFYAGWPCASTALGLARRVFEDAGV